MHRRLVLSLAVIGLLGATSAHAQMNPVGTYALQGLDTDNAAYAGQATVSQNGPGYQIMWKSQGETVYGSGMLSGSVLSIGGVYDKRAFVQMMTFDANGNAEGKFLIRETPNTGEERWIKNK